MITSKTELIKIIFTSLILINSVLEVINYPLVTLIQATGNIKKYHLFISSILLMNLPISFLFLKLGFSSFIVMVIMISLSLISLVPRIILTNRIAKMPVDSFVKTVLKPILLVLIFSIILPLILRMNLTYGFLRFTIISFTTFINCIIIIYLFGMDKKDKKFVKEIIFKK